MTTPQGELMPRERDGDGYDSCPRAPFVPLWWFGNLMAWFGGGHWRDISDRHERSSYQVAGLFVVLNGFIAWGVATFAGMGITGTGFADVLPFTVTWGVFVAAFDRSIAGFIPPFGARRGYVRKVLATRVAMAVLLGVIVGEFANLWFFAKPIEQQLLLDITRNTQTSQNAVNSSQGILDGLVAQRTALEKDITDKNDAYQKASVAFNCELRPQNGCPRDGSSTGVAGNGPQTRQRRQELADATTALEQARSRRTEVKLWVQPVEGRPAPTPETIDAQIAELENERAGQLTNAAVVAGANRGIDARWRAMHEYTLSDPAGLLLRIVVIVGLVAIDLVPLATKLMRGHTGNDDRIRLRRDILLQRNAVHRAKRTRELGDIIATHGRQQDTEATLHDMANRARLAEARAVAETDHAVVVERERLRMEWEMERLRKDAEEALSRPVPPPPDPRVVAQDPTHDPTAAEMVAPVVPSWWSQQDAGLRHMIFGGRFQALGPLQGSNRGSFGRMLIAADLDADRNSDDRHVVIKAVPLPDDEPGTLRSVMGIVRRTTPGRMWLKEIEAAGALRHRAVGRIIASGSQDGYVWTASPYYRPGSLTRWVSRQDRLGNAVTLGELLRIAGEIAAALEAAHGSGSHVIHGDLKPDNIVLDGPQPVVIDWGLARLVTSASGQRSTGLPRGTRYFGAPELFTEKGVFTGTYAPYIDLWSLGATLYFLLTGEYPLAHDVAAIFRSQLDTEEIAEKARTGQIRVTPLRHLLPGLPDEVYDLVHRLLAIEPADRSPSAEPWAAAGDLRRYIAYVAERVIRRGASALPVGPTAVQAAADAAADAADAGIDVDAGAEADADPVDADAGAVRQHANGHRPALGPAGGWTGRTEESLPPTEQEAGHADDAPELLLTEDEGPDNGTDTTGRIAVPEQHRPEPNGYAPLQAGAHDQRLPRDIPTEPGPGA